MTLVSAPRIFAIVKILIAMLGFVSSAQISIAQESVSTYPKLAGHFGIIHPIMTFTKKETTSNFDKSYTVGFPTGVNILKSDRIGFSFEVVPFIRAEGAGSKMEKFLFHPVLFSGEETDFQLRQELPLKPMVDMAVHLFSQRLSKGIKDSSFYLSVVTPARVGNSNASSVTLGMQRRISF